MKVHLASAGLLLLGFVGSATAADLARRVDLSVKAMPAPPPVVAAWTGFYAGVHGGYGWGNNSFRDSVSDGTNIVGFIGGIKSRGWVFGGQAGYNWQYGRVVTGLEIDFSAANINGEATPFALVTPDETTVTAERHDRVKYLGSARARLGALPIDSVLFYGTGGLAWQRLEHTMRDSFLTSDGIGEASDITRVIDRFGWVAGAGIEAKLLGTNWLGRVEYLHYDFDRSDLVHTTSTAGGATTDERIRTSGRQSIDVVRAGLSYRFTP